MSTDDRHDDKPESDLPAFPGWQAPADPDAAAPTATPPIPIPDPIEMPPARDEVVVDEVAVEETVVADAEQVQPDAETTATRAPLGGPYVVTETGAPIAEQAVIAYDREPLGGPYVTSSEPTSDPTPAPGAEAPTPYPAAAFAPAAATAALAADQAVPAPAGVYAPYQPYLQPILAPVPPRPKGNRGGGALLSLGGTIAFALLYAVVAYFVIAANLVGAAALSALTSFLVSAAFVVPVVVFSLAQILCVLIFNRAGWWAYILGGFGVAILVYFAGIAGALVHVGAWGWPIQEQYDFVRSLTMDPLTLAGAIVAREVSIWTGLLIARRGKRVKARNVAACEEFDRAQAAERPAAHPVPGGAPAGI